MYSLYFQTRIDTHGFDAMVKMLVSDGWTREGQTFKKRDIAITLETLAMTYKRDPKLVERELIRVIGNNLVKTAADDNRELTERIEKAAAVTEAVNV